MFTKYINCKIRNLDKLVFGFTKRQESTNKLAKSVKTLELLNSHWPLKLRTSYDLKTEKWYVAATLQSAAILTIR